MGISGSGKTTILQKFAENNNYYYISVDEIRQELSGDAKNQYVNSEAWDISRMLLKYMHEGGKTIVFDATFAKQQDRLNFMGYLKDEGISHIQGVFVDTPLEIAKARNKKREKVIPDSSIELMDKNLKENPPKLEEGFDSLFTLDENAKIIKKEFRVKDPESGKIA